MSALSSAGYTGLDAAMRAQFVWQLYDLVRPMSVKMFGVSIKIATIAPLVEQVITRMVGARPSP